MTYVKPPLNFRWQMVYDGVAFKRANFKRPVLYGHTFELLAFFAFCDELPYFRLIAQISQGSTIIPAVQAASGKRT